ncbi:MAG: hypothetical protein EA427_01410 [Spirochaetaceae bacterium]|nr:MAG: hypothetical protein EA427_01410 [Spirochaetaceae bacterium]
MPRKFPSAAECKRSASRTDDIVPALVGYAHRKQFLTEVIEELDTLDSVVSDPERFPREWKESTATILGLLPVVTIPKRMAGAVRSVGDQLTKSDLDLMRLWRRVPWAFVAFETVEPAEHGIILISPIGPPPAGWPSDLFWNRLPLFSPSLADLSRSGFRSGLVLVFWDGSLFHTYGMILTFRGFDGKDLQFFASAVDDAADGDEGIPFLTGAVPGGGESTSRLPVSDIIRNDPLPFLRLFAWQNAPSTTGRRGAWTFSASMIEWKPGEPPSGTFDPTDRTSWNHLVEDIEDFSAHTDGSVAFRIGSEGPMYDPFVVYSKEDGILFLRGMSDEVYAAGLHALAPLAVFPEYPDVRVSMTMRAAADQILGGLTDVLTQLERIHLPADDAGDEGRAPAGESTIKQIQPVLGLLMERHNEGKEYSDKEIAARTGVSEEQVRLLNEQVTGIFNRMPDTGPVPDRFGLPPKPFHTLFTSRTPRADGVLALKDLRKASLPPDEEALLEKTPILRFAHWVIKKGELPATAAGYVSPGTVQEAHDAGIVTRYFSLPDEDEYFLAPAGKELDAPLFHYFRTILETAGIIRLRKGVFVVNTDMLDAPVGPLYYRLAEALFERVPWDESRYGSPCPHLRNSGGFLLYALNKIARSDAAAADGWVDTERLVEVFIGAHPDLAGDPEEDTSQIAYWVKLNIDAQFGHRLCIPLGLAEVRRTDRTTVMRPTRVFRAVMDDGQGTMIP